MTADKQKTVIPSFWSWYERYYVLNVALAAGLFLLQLIHLYWLTTDVVLLRLTGESFFSPPTLWEYLIILVDYTEIPAIISTSLIYINQLRKKFRWQPTLFLVFINSQWLHLFWITDEFAVHQLIAGQAATILPAWLAWVAIAIDYLELPVIVDTLFKLGRAVQQKERLPKTIQDALREH
jgi:hypothetical protein